MEYDTTFEPAQDQSNFETLCFEGKIDEIKRAIVGKKYNLSSALYNACLGGHKLTIIFILEKAERYMTTWAMKGACEGGHLEIVEMLISRGATNWNFGLRSACLGGHPHIAELMISKGATNWNFGLYGACEGGHIDMAEMMISRGAGKDGHWDMGLLRAHNNNHKHMVLMMMNHGATNVGGYYIYDDNRKDIIYLLENGIKMDKFEDVFEIEILKEELKKYKDRAIEVLKEHNVINDLIHLTCSYMVL